ncbi:MULTISPECIES: exonuclease/endonuclease/phosphatase family protein [Gemella]|uniref:endonuclease n=1 Tax=Gemella TaxID=1378 RepID=UPI0007682F32|nr:MULTISPECIES: endonuclease [Gemella]AME08771.1 endonuclease [Gemella sp. oral taxon 928]
MKKILKIILYAILTCLLLFGALVGYLMATEYKPKDIEKLSVVGTGGKVVELNKDYSALDWNIGYAGLDKDEDFFMDGGEMVLPLDKNHVEENLENISKIIKNENADITFIQEIDEDSKRSYNINQVEYLNKELGLNSILAYNFKVKYIPYPLPPLGKVNSGIYTATKYNIDKAERYQMPIPFNFPEKIANLKRGFSVIYSKINNSDKQLVLINAHLDAYDKGNKGKIAQTKQLVEFIEKEYKKGNYVLVGADFNQSLRELSKEELGKVPLDLWRAENFDKSLLPSSFKLYHGTNSARLTNKPYKKGEKDIYEFVIDGYIASDNIEVSSVETLPYDYRYSDHNPVRLKFKLKG